MGGNVWEWVLGGYDVKDPKAGRRLRGGSWHATAGNCTVVYRDYELSPTGSNTNRGFRVVLSSVP